MTFPLDPTTEFLELARRAVTALEAIAARRPPVTSVESVGVQWQKAEAARHKNRDLPDFSLPASAFPDYRTGGGGTLAPAGTPQKCIRQDCDCFDTWNCSRAALAPVITRTEAQTGYSDTLAASLNAANPVEAGLQPDADDWIKWHDGWIKWHGGECPVAQSARVEYRMRDGEEKTGTGKYLDWSHSSSAKGELGPWEIVAYRVRK